MIRHTDFYPMAERLYQRAPAHNLTQREVLLFLGVSLALAAVVIFYIAIMDLLKDHNERKRDHG